MSLDDLKPGDIVKHRASGKIAVVVDISTEPGQCFTHGPKCAGKSSLCQCEPGKMTLSVSPEFGQYVDVTPDEIYYGAGV